MQTTLNNVWTDVVGEIGVLGVIFVITVYFVLAERGVVPKFWMKGAKNSGCDDIVKTLQTNHIPHIEAEIAVISNKIDNLDNKLDDVKKSAHARMDRIEQRFQGQG